MRQNEELDRALKEKNFDLALQLANRNYQTTFDYYKTLTAKLKQDNLTPEERSRIEQEANRKMKTLESITLVIDDIHSDQRALEQGQDDAQVFLTNYNEALAKKDYGLAESLAKQEYARFFQIYDEASAFYKARPAQEGAEVLAQFKQSLKRIEELEHNAIKLRKEQLGTE